MNRPLTVILLVPIMMFSSPAAAAQPRIIVDSRPEKAWIYRDNLAVFEERIDLASGKKVLLRLPSRTVIESVSVFAGGKRVGTFSLLAERIEVPSERGVKEEKTGYLLAFPPGSSEEKAVVTLRYAVHGISWRPHLDAEVIDGKRVDLTFKAVITNALDNLEDCDIVIASAAGPLGESLYFAHQRYGSQRTKKPSQVLSLSSEAAYGIGRTYLPGDGASTVAVVLSSAADYRAKYIWDTRTRERVRRNLLVRNPFPVPLCAASYRLFRNDLILDQGESEWASSGDMVTLAAGAETGVAVKRSVMTDDNPENKKRPFRHTLALSLRNNMAEDVTVEVVFGKMPSNYNKRTVYHFTREPDRRPGEIFIWEVTVAGKAKGTIPLSFDSDRARYDEYAGYEEATYVE